MKFTSRCLRKIFKDALSSNEFHITGKLLSVDSISEADVLNAIRNLNQGDLVEIFGDYKDERVHLEVIQAEKPPAREALGKVLQDSDGNILDKSIVKRFRIDDITRIFKVMSVGGYLENYKKTA